MSRTTPVQILEDVASALNAHGGIGAVCYSGGKDSIVLRHVLQPLSARLRFVWANPGATLPHMVDFIRKQGVLELASSQADRFRQVGLPARIVPIFNTHAGVQLEREPQRLLLSDHASCCHDLRVRPVYEYLHREGISVMVQGQRRSDGTLRASDTFAGVRVLTPLWDWSDEEIWAYIEQHSLELPAQYADGYPDSVECWNCTSEVSANRFEYLQRRYPEHWTHLQAGLAAVYGELSKELLRTQDALHTAFSTRFANTSSTTKEEGETNVD